MEEFKIGKYTYPNYSYFFFFLDLILIMVIGIVIGSTFKY